MTLARAFTTRPDKEMIPNFHLGRSATQRTARPVKRSQISSPVALLSSTNALSYNAPDIVGTNPVRKRNITPASATSTPSDESDAPSLSFDGTDASSIDESPMTPEPEPNHLSCYFKPAVDTKTASRSRSTGGLVTSTAAPVNAPSIPTRVPSHSKKAHEMIHRKRSVQRMMSPPASLIQRDSTEFFTALIESHAEPKEESPFGNELAQLDAVAEEMSHAVRDAEAEEDKEVMQAHGLAKFGMDDYASEIKSLVFHYLVDEAPVWI